MVEVGVADYTCVRLCVCVNAIFANYIIAFVREESDQFD